MIFKIFLLSFVFILTQAQTSAHTLFLHGDEEAGSVLLRELIEDTRGKQYEFISSQKSSYQNGDFVILWGVGDRAVDEQITQDEYKGLWRIMNYLSSNGFRVIMDVRSTWGDLKSAFASKTTSVVLFSSHGNPEGFYDYNGELVPYNILKNKAPNVYQFILSACNGRLALDNYYFIPTDLYTLSWSGLTNATELVTFLAGDNWTGFEGKPSAR